MKSLLVCVVLVAATENLADHPAKAPKRAWEWTTEERLAARFDVKLNERRRATLTERAAKQWSVHRVPRPGDFVVEGAVNPELFLPFELFDVLAESLAAGTDAATLESYYPTDAFALEASMFWREIAQIAEPYTSLLKQKHELERRLSSGEGELLEALRALAPVLCAARVEALNRSRSHFGAANFDRFLYLEVAPGMSMSGINAPHIPPTLRRLQEGCK